MLPSGENSQKNSEPETHLKPILKISYSKFHSIFPELFLYNWSFSTFSGIIEAMLWILFSRITVKHNANFVLKTKQRKRRREKEKRRRKNPKLLHKSKLSLEMLYRHNIDVMASTIRPIFLVLTPSKINFVK